MVDPVLEAGQETDGDTLAMQAYAEMEGKEVPKKKELEEAAAEPVEKQPVEVEAKPQELEEQKPAEEEKPAAEGEAPAEEVKVEETPEPDIIQKHAEKHGMTYAEAEEEISQSKALLAKYKDDPLELARAYRSQQREYDRIKSQAEKPASVNVEILTDKELSDDIDRYAAQHKDAIVEKYRTENPKSTELMEDDAIIEWAKRDAKQAYKLKAEGIASEIKAKATVRRDELIASIPKEDAKFVNDVKVVLSSTPDRILLNPNYSVKHVLWNAKGQRYDADMKANYDRGLKAGKESPKILGATGGTGYGGQKPSTPAKSGTFKATDAQRDHALDMFPDSTEAAAIKGFQEVYEKELKSNPKFLPN